MKSILRLSAAAFWLAGCCSQRISVEQFRRSPLQSQIRQYEKSLSANCLREERATLLVEIASHGCESADAMIELLNDGDRTFPVEDEFTVLRFVHSLGCDLRRHPAMDVMKRIANTASDQRI
jgi:hypothetical protein